MNLFFKEINGCLVLRHVNTLNTYLAFTGPSGIRVGWDIEINGLFVAERPLVSAGPPSGGKAATFVPYDVPGPRFGFVKLLGSLDPHCT